jgi:hypothetical protein
MNKILRIAFTFACLLTVLGGYADSFKINKLNVTNGTLTAKMGSTDITETTEIPFNTEVTLTVTPTSGYYLQSLTYEEVTDLGQAQAPQRRAPGFQTIHTITLKYPNANFGGEYKFYMPNNNVIVTATCLPLTNFNESFPVISLGDSPITYDDQAHPLVVKAGDNTLTQGTDYRITGMTFNGNSTGDNYTIKNAGDYVISIEGIGIYNGNKTSGTLTIAKKNLTITAKNQSYTYSVDGVIQTGTEQVTTNGLVTGDALTSITLTQSTVNATTTGSITPSAATTSYGIENYHVTYENGSLTINPLAVGETATGTKAIVTLTGPATDPETNIQYYNHNGSTQQPTITVTHLSNPLVIETDYTLATTGHYTDASDLSKPDIYTITVTFTGNYSGSLTKEYQIRKQVTLNNSGDFRWKTYYDPTYNMKVPTDFLAYTVQDVNVNAVVLDTRSYIKAGVPMLLYKPGASYEFYPELVKSTTEGLSGWTASGYFKSKTSDWVLDEDNNVQNETQKIWILVNDKFVRTKSGTLAAYKCYLEIAGEVTVSFARQLNFDTSTTGIELPVSYLNSYEDAIWYTLDGRKIQGKPAQKGIYITNGKKLIIK